LVHAKVPLLNHHTSGVRKEWYRSPENLEQDAKRDPFPKFRAFLLNQHFADENTLAAIENAAILDVHNDFENAVKEASPDAEELYKHIFAPSQIVEAWRIENPKEEK
jgi:2-oxoisovalerate dehydrogenase E1 component